MLVERTSRIAPRMLPSLVTQEIQSGGGGQSVRPICSPLKKYKKIYESREKMYIYKYETSNSKVRLVWDVVPAHHIPEKPWRVESGLVRRGTIPWQSKAQWRFCQCHVLKQAHRFSKASQTWCSFLIKHAQAALTVRQNEKWLPGSCQDCSAYAKGPLHLVAHGVVSSHPLPYSSGVSHVCTLGGGVAARYNTVWKAPCYAEGCWGEITAPPRRSRDNSPRKNAVRLM